ncbi:thioredoxin family protein [Helicobacter fennelliae]|uniref:Thiol:disulfide interchange protein (DsbC), putative n=1 Tax=Helicobacter fennelliae MRY12-0050 TaxID=1325130 RepID=T1D1T3_9HELI|nr:thioredoxin fold domain-containing protein [Helicobacter fennelliae]GAD20185.1 thiol:disulfide interchange protein (dsbC), putative [Helicobacter fennelliae MRY12-0050]STP08504.1 thiol:disulfide interchange protein [Helicobacter fennelliae]
MNTTLLYRVAILAILAIFIGCDTKQTPKQSDQNTDSTESTISTSISHTQTTQDSAIDSTRQNSTTQDPLSTHEILPNPESSQTTTQNSHLDLAKDLPEIFLPNAEISSNDKPILIVFGADMCQACANLKDSIEHSPALQELLSHYFSSYFVNLSTQKDYNLKLESVQQHFKHHQLREFFLIQATPSFVFLDSSGKELFRYIGAMTKSQLNITLNFLKNKNNQTLTKEQIAQNLSDLYAKNN